MAAHGLALAHFAGQVPRDPPLPVVGVGFSQFRNGLVAAVHLLVVLKTLFTKAVQELLRS